MPGAFWDKVIDFTDEPVVQCDVQDVKNISLDKYFISFLRNWSMQSHSATITCFKVTTLQENTYKMLFCETSNLFLSGSTFHWSWRFPSSCGYLFTSY